MFLDENTKKEVIDRFKDLVSPVKILYFTQTLDCQYCRETEQLLKEVAALSDLIELHVYNLQIDKDVAAQYQIDQVPAFVIMGEEDYGVRFFGIPSGYEFISLLEAILHVSRRDSGLPEEARKALAGIEQPVHLQVFVTPTCPYCPRAVMTSHQYAIENANIRADMVEATEFPVLSQQYEVMGVPRTVVNGKYYIDGGLPEEAFRERLLGILEAEKEAVNG